MEKETVIKKLDELILKTNHEYEKAIGMLLKAAVTDLTAELVEKHISESGLKGAFKLVEKYARDNHKAEKCYAISSDKALKIIFDAWALPVPEEINISEIKEPESGEQKPIVTEQVDETPKRKFRRISLDD